MDSSPKDCARAMLDTVPATMRVIRHEMRSHRMEDLSVPQFRVLTFLRRLPGASLSMVAEHIGTTLPAASRMVDRLVERELIERDSRIDDRRRITLTLTPYGDALLAGAQEETLARLSDRLSTLDEAERDSIVNAMAALSALFSPAQQSDSALEA